MWRSRLAWLRDRFVGETSLGSPEVALPKGVYASFLVLLRHRQALGTGCQPAPLGRGTVPTHRRGLIFKPFGGDRILRGDSPEAAGSAKWCLLAPQADPGPIGLETATEPLSLRVVT